MIGDFRWSARPGTKSIAVAMYWGEGGQRVARITFPKRLRAKLEVLDYPGPFDGERVRLDAALGYAIFIGIRMRVPVRLTGDMSVWDRAWGHLQVVEGREPAMAGMATTVN